MFSERLKLPAPDYDMVEQFYIHKLQRLFYQLCTVLIFFRGKRQCAGVIVGDYNAHGVVFYRRLDQHSYANLGRVDYTAAYLLSGNYAV